MTLVSTVACWNWKNLFLQFLVLMIKILTLHQTKRNRETVVKHFFFWTFFWEYKTVNIHGIILLKILTKLTDSIIVSLQWSVRKVKHIIIYKHLFWHFVLNSISHTFSQCHLHCNDDQTLIFFNFGQPLGGQRICSIIVSLL